jgi:predicted TPR repeat methyltransferase
MSVQQAYNSWASQYDTNLNKTRDLEAQALRTTLGNISFDHCLEIGCGTGKNTVWLITKAKQVTAVDLSEQMLAKAKEKVASEKVQFIQADITAPWTFITDIDNSTTPVRVPTNRNTPDSYDLVSFSLVLEHIEHLDPIFNKAANVLRPSGYLYLGELHPFKQYTGSKARFDTEAGQQVVQCYNHHISDFIQAGKKAGLTLMEVEEYFDNNDRQEIPRILTILLRKDQ